MRTGSGFACAITAAVAAGVVVVPATAPAVAAPVVAVVAGARDHRAPPLLNDDVDDIGAAEDDVGALVAAAVGAVAVVAGGGTAVNRPRGLVFAAVLVLAGPLTAGPRFAAPPNRAMRASIPASYTFPQSVTNMIQYVQVLNTNKPLAAAMAVEELVVVPVAAAVR